MLNIQGFGDNLTINNICMGNLSPAEYKKIEIYIKAKYYDKLYTIYKDNNNGLIPPLCVQHASNTS